MHSRNNCVQNFYTFVHNDVYVALIHINVYKNINVDLQYTLMCTLFVHIFCGAFVHIYVEMLQIFMGHIISPLIPSPQPDSENLR